MFAQVLLADLEAQVCGRLNRDLTVEEMAAYGIESAEEVCP